WSLDHKLVVLGSAVLAFVGSQLLGAVIGTQFFPGGERDQFFVKVWMPEGTSITANEKICRQVENALLEASKGPDGTDRLKSMVAYIGSGGPRMMLTQDVEQAYPYFSHVVINTTSPQVSRAYAEDVRAGVARIAGAEVQVELFQLGPPIKNPIAFRVSGESAEVLRDAAADILKIMRETPGAESPSSDWGFSAYQIEVAIDSKAANLAGVKNADVAATMNTLLAGAHLTTYREGDHQVPVMLRTIPERRGGLTELDRIFVNGRTGKVPLSALATSVPTWQPSVIARRDNARTVTIGCRASPGALPNEVAERIKPQVAELVSKLPPGYRLEEGGEKEKTTESQEKIGGAMMVAVLLIILVLTIQYNSLLKPLIILFTVPLALIGVMIGLWMTGWAMGFMPMLGVLSLAGIVINNAILLIDFLEEKVRDGMGLREAAATAGRIRMKPILLTSLTTIGGLLPLALFGGPLWAGMAWGIIFGLAFSTVLTLVVVPTLYVLFAERFKMKVV
ncbi:MAG: efflux RND transporter permease subunit, partial [Planctomycetota bacterium]